MTTRKRTSGVAVAPVPEPPAPPEDVSVETPPSTLSDAARGWWRTIVTTFELEPWHVLILNEAAASWDRAQEARRCVDRDGAVVFDRFHQSKPHPGVQIERDSTATFLRCMRELDIDNAPPDDPRPARMSHNR